VKAKLRVGLELQRAELEQQVQRDEEARRRLCNLQQKADQGRAQHNITANAKAGRMKPQDNVHVHHRQRLRSERRAARRPTDYGARARAGGTGLVAVLHAASVIGCWGRAADAASLRTAPDAPPPHT